MALMGKMEGEKDRVRQRETFIASLMDWKSGNNINNTNFIDRYIEFYIKFVCVQTFVSA